MSFSSPTWTVLELTGMGVVPYSTRQATQSLEPIRQAGASVYRDVNGVLRNAGGTRFQKYRSVISCTDQRPFAVDGVWPGKLVTVGCIATLSYLTSGGAPQRTPVPGSSLTEGSWTFYRPQLSMMVLRFSLQENEYGAEVGWSMELEEV
ncbi:MAG: hypothetical protein ABFD96_25405 [Armatimonadia bacterium]